MTMTKLEEYQYLSDLVMQAALWRVDKDEGRTALELEVLDRMNKLKEELSSDSEKKTQIAVEQREKGLTYKHKWAEDKCRVDGKWFKKSDCVQVPRKDGNGWKWALKDSEKEYNLSQKEEPECQQ
jgi:hypothetical protein